MEPRPPYKDSPPSYVEAMSADYDYPSSSRRLTAARTSSTFHPVLYCHLSSDAHVFPRTFGVYTSTPRHYYIGGSQEFPLYAISTRSLQPMKPDLVLYSGVSEDSALARLLLLPPLSHIHMHMHTHTHIYNESMIVRRY